MQLGVCPKCQEGVIKIEEKLVCGKKVKRFVCSNAAWESEDGELWELKEEATCDFRIWQNALARYGKWLNYKEVRELLTKGELEVELVTKKYGKKIYYTKHIILDMEYGVSVLWND